ncbi:peptidylprolyl isomerase [Planctomycetota bacterium]
MAYANSFVSNKPGNRHCLVITLLILVALALPGCRRKPKTPPAVAAPNEVSVTTPPQTVVLATVNNKRITLADVESDIQAQLAKIENKQDEQPLGYIEQRKKEITKNAVDAAVAMTLLEEQVVTQGISITDEAVQERVKQLAATQSPAVSAEVYLRLQQQKYGQNAADFREQVRRDLAIRALLSQQFAGKFEVSDAEATAYYQAHRQQFTAPEQIRVSHIQLTATDGPKAQAILAQLREGADFAELARAHSTDAASASQGGDVGFFAFDDMEKPFAEAAFALAPGQLSDVFSTRYGLHILLGGEKKAAATQTAEEAKADIVALLAAKKKQTIQQRYIRSLLEQAQVQINLP